MEYNHKYDPYGMPVSFVQTLDSSVWRELMVYDASGWRVASLAYENDSLRAIRTDIMVGGKKVLERRMAYSANDSSVAEYRMIQGKSGIVGRILPDSSKEWYIKDYQGSLVMTLVDNGTGNVFAYEPYGAQQKIQVSGESPAEQYTGKELNERVGLYYYGARFFDPVFGIWMTPDPARQYMNLYAFGGDPVNALDLYGLWKISLGIITIGYENGGFTAGVGVALDVGNSSFGIDIDIGYSHNFGNGSNTYSANVGAAANIGIFNVGANLGYAYNDQSGSTLSYGIRGGAYGTGIGAGGAQYWDTHGSYLGSTLYVETYAGAFGAEAYTGYEWGFSGMEGRGLYTGARAWGVHAEYAQNGGFSWGGRGSTSVFDYESKSVLMGLGTNASLSQGNDYLIDEAARSLATNPDEFSFVGHFANSEDNYGVETGFYDYVEPETKDHWGYHSINDVADEFSSGRNGFDGNKDIRMYSCSLAKYGGASDFSKLVPNANVWAATNDIRITEKSLNFHFPVKQTSIKYYSAKVINGGTWVKYRNGSLVQ